MKLDYLTPMLWTNDIKASIDFYQTVLGFELDNYNEAWGWCHMHKDKVCVMFTTNEHAPNKESLKFTGSFYIYTQDVDELWSNLKTKAAVCYEVANFVHNMREFGIFDNNGYLLQFGRELKEGEIVDDCD